MLQVVDFVDNIEFDSVIPQLWVVDRKYISLIRLFGAVALGHRSGI